MKPNLPSFLILLSLLSSCLQPADRDGGNSADGNDSGSVFLPDNGCNLYGRVTESLSGLPLCNIPVTDGYQFSFTDADGYYQMKAYTSDKEYARTVSVSVPSGFAIPFGEDGSPAFFQYITMSSSGMCRRDFSLKRLDGGCRDFSIIALADIHIKEDSHLSRFVEETLTDLTETVSDGEASGTLSNPVVLTLGDNVWDNAKQYEPFKKSISALKTRSGKPLNVLTCIGNHDLVPQDGNTEMAVTSTYVQHFGPYDYSFNVGNVHFVFMKNFRAEGVQGKTVSTVPGFSDMQISWLRQDLDSIQDKDEKLLIFCGHYPVHELPEPQRSEFLKMLAGFGEAHCFTGHHHGVYNRTFEKYPTRRGEPVYDHNQIAACGAWWHSNINPDGVPNGYMIYNVRNNHIGAWYLKPTGKKISEDQIRIYDGSETYAGTEQSTFNKSFSWSLMLDDAGSGLDLSDKFIVKVYGADSYNWSVSFEQDGRTVDLERVSENIYDACTYTYSYNFYPVNLSYLKNDYARYKVKNSNYWYIERTEVNPERPWVVKAFQTFSDGTVLEYRCNEIHSGYEDLGGVL